MPLLSQNQPALVAVRRHSAGYSAAWDLCAKHCNGKETGLSLSLSDVFIQGWAHEATYMFTIFRLMSCIYTTLFQTLRTVEGSIEGWTMSILDYEYMRGKAVLSSIWQIHRSEDPETVRSHDAHGCGMHRKLWGRCQMQVIQFTSLYSRTDLQNLCSLAMST